MDDRVNEFLHKYGMHHDSIDMDVERDKLVIEMKDGLAGKPSSLMMIPSFIVVDKKIEQNEEVLVLDAGGTNFRVATAKMLEGGTISISNYQKYLMPGTQGQISIDDFFETVADRIESIIDKTDVQSVGFCFSYPVEIMPNREGRLVAFCKEVDIVGVNGQLIGENINKVLTGRGVRTLRFSMLNDTVAAMLSGILGVSKKYAGYVGYILGTGTNTCYLEDCKAITKNTNIMKMDGHMAINMESGIYTGFKLGTFDVELDSESQNPGDHLMEKMMSGAYQGELIYKTVKKAVDDEIFSKQFASRMKAYATFTMEQIDAFCADQNGDGEFVALCSGCVDDKKILYDIIDASFERSSKMTAILFAAIIEQMGVITTPEVPVCITAEGTSFTKSVLFRPKLDRYIEEYLNEQLAYYCEIVSFEDATLRGSACAALL